MTYIAGIGAALATSFAGILLVKAASPGAVAGLIGASVVAAAIAATIASRVAR